MVHDSYQVVIIGAGPAGVACARELSAMEVDYVILDAAMGGHTNIDYGVGESGQSSREWFKSVVDFPINLVRTNARHIQGFANHWEVSTQDEWCCHCQYLVIATGTKARTGGFTESENLLIGPFKPAYEYDYTGKHVAILGGGDNAFEYAAIALSKGASSASIFARGIRARKDLRAAATSAGASVHLVADFDVKDMGGHVDISGNRYDICLVMYGFERVIPDIPDGQCLSPSLETVPGNSKAMFVVGDVVHGAVHTLEWATNSGKEAGIAITTHLKHGMEAISQ